MDLKLPETYDNPYSYLTGHDFVEAPWKHSQSETWDYFERYRFMSWGDIVASDESQSSAARWFEQGAKVPFLPDWKLNEKGPENNYPEGYFNEITGETEETSGDLISAEEANEKYGLHGRLNFNNDVSIAEAQLMHERKISEMKYQDVYNRSHGFWKNAGMIGVGMTSALWDPANLGAMFIPIGGQAAFLANVGRIGLTGSRFWRGAKAGALFTTAFEIPTAAQLYNEQADYSMWHSLMNVSFGTLLGGGLHVLGGRGADWMRGISHKRHEAALKVAAGQVAAGKDIDVKAIIQAARNIAKSSPEGRILDDTEANILLKQEYDEIAHGKIPPSRQIEYKSNKDVEDSGPTIGQTEDGGGVKFNQQDHALDLDQMQVVSPKQLGSNKGGVYNTPDGTTWYVKNIENNWAVNEMLAGWILKLLGVNVPEVRLVHSKGKIVGVASKWLQGSEIATLDKIKKIKATDPDAFDKFAESYVIQAWLGNWDFAAPGNLVIKNGQIYSIDHGGSLLFRAQGKLKSDTDLNNHFKEIVSLLDPGRSHHAIVKLLDAANIKAGIAKLYSLDDNTIMLLGEALKLHADPVLVNKMVSLLLGRKLSLKTQDHGHKKITFPGWLGKNDPKWNNKTSEVYRLTDDVSEIAQMAMNESLKNKPKFQVFHTQNEAVQWLAKQIAMARKNLTHSEKKVLTEYQGGDLPKFNKWLRDGRPEADIKGQQTGVYYSPTEVAQYKPLYEIFKKLEDKFGISIQTTTHRKTGAHHFKFEGIGKIDEGTDLNLIIGKEIQDLGYQSTSITELKAISWNYGTPSKNLVIHYTLKKNQSVIFAGAGKGDIYPHEIEIILPPNTWKIKQAFWKTHGEGKKLLHMYVEASPKKGDPDAIEGVLPGEMLSSSQHYHKNVKSNTTADVELSPDDIKLSKVEETLKVEADPDIKALQKIQKEIDDVIDLGATIKNKQLDADIKAAQTELKEATSKIEWMKKGLTAAANCIIGKI